jgi:cytochrome P450
MPGFHDGIMDGHYIAEKCPLLESAFHEVLRLHITSNTVRYVEAETTFQGKILEPGNPLMMPLLQLNHLPDIWGRDHNTFNPTRFLRNKGLASHTAFRPFGGGPNLCPGKAFASRQVITYVAYLLYKFDVHLPELNGKPQQFPKNQHDTLAFGVAVPKPGTDYVVELTRSANVDIKELKQSPKTSN